MTSWIANISTSVTTVVLLVGLIHRFLIMPFKVWVDQRIDSALAGLETVLHENSEDIRKLQEKQLEVQKQQIQVIKDL